MSDVSPGTDTPTPSQSGSPTPDPTEQAAAQPFLDQLDAISSEEDANEWLMRAADQLDEPELGIVVRRMQEKFPNWAQHQAAQEDQSESDEDDSEG
jgi:hypothetical protein